MTAAILLTVLTVPPALRAAELLPTPTLAAVLMALPADLAPPTAGPSWMSVTLAVQMVAAALAALLRTSTSLHVLAWLSFLESSF